MIVSIAVLQGSSNFLIAGFLVVAVSEVIALAGHLFAHLRHVTP